MTRGPAEPLIRVGLIEGAGRVNFSLLGGFTATDRSRLEAGDYSATASGDGVAFSGRSGPSVDIRPRDPGSRIRLHGVAIGIDFHWQRYETQELEGALSIIPSGEGLTVINELPLESYLLSVISSEMSASSPKELLRAHAIISRSWLLAQLRSETEARSLQRKSEGVKVAKDGTPTIIRWYDRERHSDFDVCADDHCQRYQGIGKAFSEAALDAVRDTRGKVLTWNGCVCDARYSKCCGGMTERFSAAWGDIDVPYLSPVYDDEGPPVGFEMPLSDHSKAEPWIRSRPRAFCNVESQDLLARVLPGFDQETRDFFRWRVEYAQDELRDIVDDRLGLDLGAIRSLRPLERGDSGRIVTLGIEGERRSVVLGKELEIRRVLSRSHLYSSAFIVETHGSSVAGHPERIVLIGAGWGHGVGLCQIGAAAMADQGYGYEEILSHYFAGTSVEAAY